MTCPVLHFGYNEKSYLTFKDQIALYSLFDGVISDVANTLPNAVLSFQKPRVYAGFQCFGDYSYSTGLNQFCLGNIARPVRSPFDNLIYPYYPAYHPFRYHFVIRVDNSGTSFTVNMSGSIPYPLILFHTSPILGYSQDVRKLKSLATTAFPYHRATGTYPSLSSRPFQIEDRDLYLHLYLPWPDKELIFYDVVCRCVPYFRV